MRSAILATAAMLLLISSARPQAGQGGLSKPMPDVAEVEGKNLAQWIQLLKSPDPAVKETAIQNLIPFGKRSREAVPLLVTCLSDADASVRVNACITLSIIGASAEDVENAVKALRGRLTENENTKVRYHAMLALAALGTASRPAVPQLIDQSKSGYTYELRKAAVFALGQTQSEDNRMRIVTALLDRIKNDVCGQVRKEAVLAIGFLGLPKEEGDRITIKQVLTAKGLTDRDKTVAVWAHVGLMAIDEKTTDAHLRDIARLLRDPELTVRIQAAKALGTVGKQAKSYVPDLIKLLWDREAGASISAAWALGNLGTAAESAMDDLTQLSRQKDVDENVRQSALAALKMIKEEPKRDGGQKKDKAGP